jgi:hypothetical protein
MAYLLEARLAPMSVNVAGRERLLQAKNKKEATRTPAQCGTSRIKL